MNPPLRIVTTPRLQACAAKTVWDGEAALLRTTIEYAPEPPETARTLRERMGERLGIRERPKRLVLGGVDIAYRDERHIDAVELRTTPSSWQRGPIDHAPTDAAPVWLAFDLEYDANGIFSLDLPIGIRWDAVAERLALVFGPDAANNWYRIADGLLVGTSVDSVMTELRFSAVEILAAPERRGR